MFDCYIFFIMVCYYLFIFPPETLKNLTACEKNHTIYFNEMANKNDKFKILLYKNDIIIKLSPCPNFNNRSKFNKTPQPFFNI
jgi:hypothetical protein